MLVIRDAQLRELAAEQRVARVLARLRRNFPERCAELGDDGLRELVRVGEARAHAHGFTEPSRVSQYLNLVVAFGPSFDTDPQTAWAADILADPELYLDEKLDALHAAALRAAEAEVDDMPRVPEDGG